ncbi:MAG TPA: hypothetical protein VK348_15060, partial [Planctomycetota bacterium]|nr:hypothetical protein [Planctomycetota bacterium]
GLDQLAVMAAKMATAGLPIHLAQWLSNGFLCRLVGDQKNAGLNLEAAASQLAGSYPPLLGEDPLAVVMQLRIDLARERGAKVSEVIDLLQNWAKASGRADRIEPLLAKVRYQLEAADPSAALASADEALRRAPQDEAVLRLLAQTAERAFESAGQNAAGLLQQCRRSRSLVPDSPPHPICYLLCGEAALHEHELPVAHGCGLKAIDKFTWSAWPRRLVGKALADDPTHAVAVLQELHALHPDDQEGVLLLLEARARAGQSIDDLVFDALRVGAPGPLLATALLRAALRSGDIPSLQAIAHSQAAGPQPSVEQQALLAQAAATSGDFAAATTALHAAASALTDDADRARRSDLATAVAAVLAAQLPRAADQELAQQTRWWQGQLCGSLLPAVAQTFLDSATRAAAAGKPQTAYALLTTALGLDGAAAARNGAVFTQAGRLALRLHCWQDAEHHFTAAVSFADGAAAAEPLARLHLLQRHDERAAQALRLCQQPRDAALAQRLDDPATAQRLLRSALASDADDLLAQCTMAASAQVAASALGAELRELEGPARADCLLLLSLLADPDLGELAVPRAEALLARLPDSHAARLLLARAQSDAGQAAAAARLHAQVFADGCRDGVLLAEAVRAASRPDYLMPAALQAELRALLPQPGALANDRVQAFAVRELAATTALAGHPELARRMLADFWIRHPAQSGARVADAVTLFVQGQQQDALRLFIALVPVLTGDERLASLRGLFSTALALASASDDQTSAIVRTIAWTVLEQDGAFGPALHFLLTDDRRAQRTDPSAPVTAARARELLRAHLERCADGREDVGSALWSLRLLEERCGSDEALLGVEHLLQRAPALLPAWLWRAQLLQRLQRPGEGLSDLRHLLQIANDPQLVVAVVTLAGELRACTAADRQLLADLPREMLSQPAVQFAGGLLLLRAGRADAALPLLGAGPPRDDGSHLYFRALAALACSHANAREQAGPLFAQLAADYPNSSLARYAGSFARQ